MGLSTLVDHIKNFLGLEPQENRLTEKGTLESKDFQEKPILSQQKGGAPSTLSRPIVQDIPFEERLAEYRKFEEKTKKNEEENIEAVENKINTKLNEIMKDPRVVELTQRNPELPFEDLPQDIYNTILPLSRRQEDLVTQIMEETDKLLVDRAVALGVYERLGKEEASRDNEKQKKLEKIKSKMPVNAAETIKEIIPSGKEKTPQITPKQKKIAQGTSKKAAEDNLLR